MWKRHCETQVRGISETCDQVQGLMGNVVLTNYFNPRDFLKNCFDM